MILVPSAEKGAPNDETLGVQIYDLTFELSPGHFRWRTETTAVAKLEDGGPFQTTRLAASVHSFTHADAPSHVRLGSLSMERVALATFVGPACVINLCDVEENEPITAERLAAAAAPLRPGDIALLRTDWDLKQSIDSVTYWTFAPYLTRDAAAWLADAKVGCVGFDFPQDYPIRSEFIGERPAPEEFVTHRLLLARGIGLVEYLRGLWQLPHARTFFSAAPLKISGSDGAPVRAFALDTALAAADEAVNTQER